MSVESLKRKLLRARVLYVLGLLSPIIAIASIVIHRCEVFGESIKWLVEPSTSLTFLVSGIYSVFFFVPGGTRKNPNGLHIVQLKNDISNLKLAIPKEIDRLPKTW